MTKLTPTVKRIITDAILCEARSLRAEADSLEKWVEVANDAGEGFESHFHAMKAYVLECATRRGRR